MELTIRKQKDIASGYKLVLGYFGIVTMLIGFINLLPLLTLFFYPEEMSNAKYFVITGVVTILIGYLFSFYLKGREKGQLHKHQDAVIVVGTWIIGILVSAMPFMLTGSYNFTQAIFEATSGFSTTGLSVVDVSVCPKIFLMHRSIMLFFGGIGFVLVLMSVLSDAYGMRLYTAEGHSDKLMPNLIKSARVIIAIYSGYILGGTVLYTIFGMHPFDALNHSIAAVSTGGFSTKPQSIGFYNSVPIELVTIVLMILGCTNFFVHLLLLRGKVKAFFIHCEMKFMLFVIAFTVPVISVLLLNSFSGSIPQTIREAVFQAVSAITTTGFQTVETFNTWTSPLIFVMIVLHLIGGGAGSTAGGIKQFRVYIVLKEMWWQIRGKFSHKRVIKVNQVERFGEKQVVDEKMTADVNAFVVLYLLIFLTGSFIFTLFGYSLEHAMFEFSSALGTVGLSVGITGYSAHPVILWTATIGMFVGRLEIYVIFLAMIRLIQDTKGKVRAAK